MIHNRHNTEKRKALRREMTDAERVLWSYLRHKKLEGRKFRRQESIGAYIVDFYCHEEKLIIEIDGSIHNLKTQKIYDEKRTSFLETNGYRVMRFTNKEIFMRIHEVLSKISEGFNRTPSK